MGEASITEKYRARLESAKTYAEIWNLVKDNVEFYLHERRRGIMLFLDDLPIRLGAYHPIGTNNIVLNRRLVQVVEATNESQRSVNALIYNLLIHEYLHALGKYSEIDVRRLVYEIACNCFGEGYVATVLAKKSPWALLRRLPFDVINAPRRVMEIVKDFEKADDYVI